LVLDKFADFFLSVKARCIIVDVPFGSKTSIKVFLNTSRVAVVEVN
jgi:hypothetical protein